MRYIFHTTPQIGTRKYCGHEMRSQLKNNQFRIHFGLFLAELICIPAFLFETSRALHGNTLSWAYVVEWPILALYAVYMWAKMLKEERGEDARSRSRGQQDAARALQEHDDPELRAWNEYLASVRRNDGQDEDKREA